MRPVASASSLPIQLRLQAWKYDGAYDAGPTRQC